MIHSLDISRTTHTNAPFCGGCIASKPHLKGFGHNPHAFLVDPGQTKLEILHVVAVAPALCLSVQPLTCLARQLRLNALQYRHSHEDSSCMERGRHDKERSAVLFAPTTHSCNLVKVLQRLIPERGAARSTCLSPTRTLSTQEHHDRRARGASHNILRKFWYLKDWLYTRRKLCMVSLLFVFCSTRN